MSDQCFFLQTFYVLQNFYVNIYYIFVIRNHICMYMCIYIHTHTYIIKMKELSWGQGLSFYLLYSAYSTWVLNNWWITSNRIEYYLIISKAKNESIELQATLLTNPPLLYYSLSSVAHTYSNLSTVGTLGLVKDQKKCICFKDTKVSVCKVPDHAWSQVCFFFNDNSNLWSGIYSTLDRCTSPLIAALWGIIASISF